MAFSAPLGTPAARQHPSGKSRRRRSGIRSCTSSPEVDQELPRTRLYQTWRAPRWLNEAGTRAGPEIDLHRVWVEVRESAGPALARVGPLRESTGVELKRVQRLALRLKRWTEEQDRLSSSLKSRMASRAIAILSLLLVTVGSWLGYRALDYRIGSAIVATSNANLGRQVSVGRLHRVGRRGFRFRGVTLSSGETISRSAPELSIGAVDVSFTGIVDHIVNAAPVRVNFVLHDLKATVQQKTTPSTLSYAPSIPVYLWDTGLPQTASSIDPAALLAQALPRRLRPGEIRISNAAVDIYPAGFAEYGYGRTPQKLTSINGSVAITNFPRHRTAKVEDLEMRSSVSGHVVDGGKLFVSASCRLRDALSPIEEKRPFLHVDVDARGVRSRPVVGFLNLPLLSEAGKIGGKISLVLRKGMMLPEMHGDVLLDSVDLKFHANPKSPELTNVNGRLRLDERVVYFEGPSGKLGTLPITAVGSVDLVGKGEFDLNGYIRKIDVNDVLDTFKVDKFVHVEGFAQADAHMSGSLEEPIVQGHVQSVGEGGIFDRVPFAAAEANFRWDPTQGSVLFDRICANLIGGGSIDGHGGCYFDMEKFATPNQLLKLKARREFRRPSPAAPTDELCIDEFAKERDYESLDFHFNASEIPGETLITLYGGAQGQQARKTFGNISGSARLAGWSENPTCEVRWHTSTAAPRLETLLPVDGGNSISGIQSALDSIGAGSIVPHQDGTLGDATASGTLWTKLGDPPEKKRVRLKTVVKRLDSRRTVYQNDELRKAVLQVPLANISCGFEYEGEVYQEIIIPTGLSKAPRGAQMKLLGSAGNLKTTQLTLNGIHFNRPMQGTFRFSENEIDLNISETQLANSLSFSGTAGHQTSLCLKQDSSLLDLNYDAATQKLKLVTEALKLEPILGVRLGPNCSTTANVQIDLLQERGKADVEVSRIGIGNLGLESMVGEVDWLGDVVVLHRSVIKQEKGEYHFEGMYQLPYDGTETQQWELKCIIPRADVAEITHFAASPEHQEDSPSGNADFRVEWSVPDLSLEQHLLWFENFLVTQKELEQRGDLLAPLQRTKEPLPGLADIQGTIFGTISIRHNGEKDLKKAVSLDADLGGDDLHLGPHFLGQVRAKTSYKNGSLVVEPVYAQRREGLEVAGFARVLPGGEVDGLLSFRRAPVEALRRYMSVPIEASGRVSADIELSGTLDNPVVDGKAVWTRALLNRQKVRDAACSLSLHDGRFAMDVAARIGTRGYDESEIEVGQTIESKKRPGEMFKFNLNVPMQVSLKSLWAMNSIDLGDLCRRSVKDGSPGWISANAEVNRYGIILLNAVVPQLSWIDGSSDLSIAVRGNVDNPVVEGSASLTDATLWPSIFPDALERVSGAVNFSKNGILEIDSIVGTAKGRPFKISGALPLKPSEEANNDHTIRVELKGLPLNIEDVFLGTVTSDLRVSGSVQRPVLAGAVGVSDGVIFAASPSPNINPDDISSFEYNEKFISENVPFVGFQKLNLSLGKNVQIIYPYLLNFGANGSLTLSGSTESPSPAGRIYFSDGELNLVATKLELQGGSDNYATFTPGSGLDPILHLRLEDGDVCLRMNNVKATKWAQHVELVNKSGALVDQSAWVQFMTGRLDEIRRGLADQVGIPNLAAKALVNTYSAKGHVGSASWRIYPTLINILGGSGGKFERVGVGADIEKGRFGLSLKRGIHGSGSTGAFFRPNDRLKLNFDCDGPQTTAGFKWRLFGKHRGSKKVPSDERTSKRPDARP